MKIQIFRRAMINIFNDDHGVTEDTYVAMIELGFSLADTDFTKSLERVVKSSEQRFFISEEDADVLCRRFNVKLDKKEMV